MRLRLLRDAIQGHVPARVWGFEPRSPQEARQVLDKRRGQRTSGEPAQTRLDHVTYAEETQALRVTIVWPWPRPETEP